MELEKFCQSCTLPMDNMQIAVQVAVFAQKAICICKSIGYQDLCIY